GKTRAADPLVKPPQGAARQRHLDAGFQPVRQRPPDQRQERTLGLLPRQCRAGFVEQRRPVLEQHRDAADDRIAVAEAAEKAVVQVVPALLEDAGVKAPAAEGTTEEAEKVAIHGVSCLRTQAVMTYDMLA